MLQRPFIELKGIHKQFCGMSVLSGIDLSLCAGETHGLLGCNGAGKSTLVRILAGELQPDSGEILLNGQPICLNSCADSVRNRIAISMQDLKLFENMSVADNLFLTNRSTAHQFPINYSRQREKAQKVLSLLQLNVGPDQKVGELAQSEKYLIQFGRCYLASPLLLVLDELSASLTPVELHIVHNLVQELKDRGTAVLYITHRIEDILEASDRLTILRDGKVTATSKMNDFSENELRTYIFGDTLPKLYPKLKIPFGEEVLRVSHIGNKYFNDISLSLHRGEIYGILGLSGSGRSRLLRAIAGIDPIQTGSIEYLGKPYKNNNTKNAASIAYIPEDRDVQALFKNIDTYKNISISNMKVAAPHRIINLQKEAISCRNLIDRLGIHGVNLHKSVRYLSGGNKQKVVIARNLYSHCSVYLFDEPTQGIDTAGKVEVYNIISELARKGAGIIYVSSDYSELFGMCDRILTIRRGKVLDDSSILDISPTDYSHVSDIKT